MAAIGTCGIVRAARLASRRTIALRAKARLQVRHANTHASALIVIAVVRKNVPVIMASRPGENRSGWRLPLAASEKEGHHLPNHPCMAHCTLQRLMSERFVECGTPHERDSALPASDS
jgi:hypothetical protein